MCGIAGIVALAPGRRVDPDEPRRMADALIHRGPDAGSAYLDPQGRAGLGFRRLAIIDLETGGQPISNEDRTVWVAFNGEIYNFRELRDSLRASGHVFRSHGDAEVIVHAYEEFGAACVERLHGMFAIAIWDERRGRLLLARDRLGKKPLHYALCDGRLAFASELKALAPLPWITREIDWQSVHRYLVFQYVPAPHSIYRGVRKLLPGEQVLFEVGRERPAQVQRYWTPPRVTPRFDGSYVDARRRLGDLLTAAVAKRLVSDVPLGAFLSGGVDSSIVVGLMRRLGASPLRTFSIGFDDPRYDESNFARIVARHFATEHHEHVVTPSAADVLDLLAHHYDEPFADSSAIPTYFVSRHTRTSVTVALTGDGGDECLAGYDRYRAVRVAARLDAVPAALRRLASSLAPRIPHGRSGSLSHRLHRFARAVGMPAAQRYLDWVAVFPPDVLSGGYAPEFAAQLDLGEPLRWFEALYADGGATDADRAVYADLCSYLPYDLLTKVDIASMACSLECRAPFLDHELIEFAASLPVTWRIGARGGKHILKDWAAELLPPEILARRKQGFGVPVGEWFRRELRDVLREAIFAPDSLCARLFRPDWLQRVFDGHASARENHEHRLWALLMLEKWHRRWGRGAGT